MVVDPVVVGGTPVVGALVGECGRSPAPGLRNESQKKVRKINHLQSSDEIRRNSLKLSESTLYLEDSLQCLWICEY